MVDAERKPVLEYLPVILLVVGLLLVCISFVPFSSVSKRAWTLEDSQAFSAVTRELHQSTIDSPDRAARTSEEQARIRSNLEREFERLNSKLEQAQAEPRRLSRLAWWAGVILVATGAALHFTKSPE